MKYATYISVFIFVGCAGKASAQTRNANMLLMGHTETPGAQLDLGGVVPVVVGVFPFDGWGECSSAISDTSGNLLIGFGNRRAYNQSGGVIDQGVIEDAVGNSNVTQGSLIFPRPGSDEVYDLFVIKNTPSSPWQQAAVLTVDMALNDGLGGVTSSFSFGENYTEKLSGTPHGNGTDYWALTHEWGSSAFRAYRIAAAGLDTVPVVSLAGSPHTEAYGDCPDWMNTQGEMKCSYLGDHVALCTQNRSCIEASWAIQPSIVQLFHFNDLTGEVSYWMDLPGHHMTYGLDFSQDGSKLYVAGSDTVVHYVDQYDLAAGDTTAIIGSRYRVYDSIYTQIGSNRPNAMAFAPDGRLYVSHLGTSLDAILHPDLPGADCGYTEGFFPLGNMHYFATHCNQLKRYHDSEYKRPGTVGIPVVEQEPGFAAWPNPAATVLHLRLPQDLASPAIRIHDATARIVYEPGRQAVRAGTIDVSGLANGLYTVSLLDGGQVLGATRLVVQH